MQLAAESGLPVATCDAHSEDVTYRQVTGQWSIYTVHTLNHDPGLNPVNVEVFRTGYWDDNKPKSIPDTGYSSNLSNE